VSRRAKTGSLLLLAVAVAGAAAIHRATHGIWFPRRATATWPPRADANAPATGWTPWNPIPIGSRIEGIWGKRPDDVWAWNVAGIMHWDGQTWTRVSRPPQTLAGVDAIAGTPAGLVLRMKRYHPGRHRGCDVRSEYTETSHWCRIANRWERGICVAKPGGGVSATMEDTRFALPAQPAADLVGGDELARLWASHAEKGTLPVLSLERGWRVGDGELWAVDKDDRWLLRFDGSRWTGAAQPFRRSGGAGIWFATENDGWAIGGQTISHWDGREWTPLPPQTPGSIGSIWGTAADDVWAVGGSGSGLVMHYDGLDWRARPFPDCPGLASVSGRARDDVWVTGCDKTGFAAHWDGSGWTQFSIASPGQNLPYGRNVCPVLVPARDGRTLAAVEGSLYLFAPLTDRWRPIEHPLSGYLGGKRWGPGEFAAFAAGPGAEFWGVGKRYGAGEDERSPVVLRHAAGDEWTKGELPADWGSASAVWPRAADDVWVVGTAGLILHFDGHTWTHEPSGTDESLVGVHGAGRTVWVIGAEGGLYRRKL
jgi:hypothetical protein